MKKLILPVTLALITALSPKLHAAAAPARADLNARVFRAGAATSNISPALGMGIVGGWEAPPATNIHDELHARCLVLDDGTTPLVLVVVDSVGVPREVFDEAKKLVRDATRIPVENQMMSATHTHRAVSARGKDPLKYGSPLDDYQKFLIRRIADGVRRAIENMEPARIGWGAGQVPQHVFNRRWLLKDGKTTPNPFGGQDRVMKPGADRSQVLKPAGPVNPEVYFVSLQSVGGRPIALLANYWLHYVGPAAPAGLVSADYFGAFCDRIQELLGADRQSPPFVGLLANGPCGDVANSDFSGRAPARRYKAFEKIREVANDVAQEVLRVHRTIAFHEWVELRAVQSELTLRMRRPSPEMVARAEAVLARPPTASPIHIREVTYAKRTLTAKEWPATTDVILQSFRIGELGIAAIPFEVFAETGLRLKAGIPFKDTFTIELANGSTGYLPTPEQHELGGYETWLGTSRVETEASDKITAVVLDQFKRLQEKP
jgi:neutral ceramidase